jgi:hypothetical protein
MMDGAHFEDPFPQASYRKDLDKDRKGLDAHDETEGDDQQSLFGENTESYEDSPEKVGTYITHENPGWMGVMPEKPGCKGEGRNTCRLRSPDRTEPKKHSRERKRAAPRCESVESVGDVHSVHSPDEKKQKKKP